MDRLVLDTSVLVEYIIARSPYRALVGEIFERAARGSLELYVNTVTLAEAFYVASRVYSLARVADPNREAEHFLLWVTARARVVGVERHLSMEAGELKKRLGIAFPDCFVIATARKVGGRALFKRPEREMKRAGEELRRLGVVFLEEMQGNVSERNPS